MPDGSSTKYKYDKQKETDWQTHQSKNAEKQRQGDNLESNKKKNPPILWQKNPVRSAADFSAETVEAEGIGIIYSRCSKENTGNQESYIQQTICKKMKAMLLNLFLSALFFGGVFRAFYV